MPSYLKRIGANLITKIEPKWFFLDKRIKKVSSLDVNYKRNWESLIYALQPLLKRQLKK